MTELLQGVFIGVVFVLLAPLLVLASAVFGIGASFLMFVAVSCYAYDIIFGEKRGKR